MLDDAYTSPWSQDRIPAIAAEIERRAKARRDYVTDRRSMRLVQVGDNEPLMLAMDEVAGDTLYPFRDGSLKQLANTLRVPVKYVDRLAEADHHDLVRDNFNALLAREPKRHLVRTLDGEVDAVLSDRYRALDNADLMLAAYEQVKDAGAVVWDLRLTRDSFRMLAVAPEVAGEVSRHRPGDHHWWRHGDQPDRLYAAVTIRNSETGRGGLGVRPSMLRQVCSNFVVVADGVARVHVGGRLGEDGEVFWTDDTRRRENELVWSQVRDVVRGTFDPENFERVLGEIELTTSRGIERPTEAVDAAVKDLGLPQDRRDAILEELLGSGDRTQYGLANAITAQANPDQAGDMTDDLRNRYEDAGGKVLTMDARAFGQLVAA